MKINLIAAVAQNGVIGVDGGIPWSVPEDMKLFARLTKGGGRNAVIMGLKTWLSIPEKFRPLPERFNIVLTSSAVVPGVQQEQSLGSAFRTAQGEGCEEVWLCGGQRVYQEAMTRFIDPKGEFRLSEMHVTHIEVAVPNGDAFFPSFSSDGPFRVIHSSWPPKRSESGISYSYKVYKLGDLADFTHG